MGVAESKILVPGTPHLGWPCIKWFLQEKRGTRTNSRIEMYPGKWWFVIACELILYVTLGAQDSSRDLSFIPL